jgi:hypothetical protein
MKIILTKIFLILLFFTALLKAENTIKDVVNLEYYNQQLDKKFDTYVDLTINNYKQDTNYLKKLGANNGLYIESQVNEITNTIMQKYSKDIDKFVDDLLENSILIYKIEDNYNNYITKSSNIVSQKLGDDFKSKYLQIYSSDNLKNLLKEDIKNKISSSKDNILKKLEKNIANEQLTLGQIVIGTLAISFISKTIAKRIVLKATTRGLLKWIPLVGWGLAAYDLATVDTLYDSIATEIKEEFHINESLLINRIASELSNINNISNYYKQNISNISFNFIQKSKPIYLATKNNLFLRNKILNSDNYTYIQFSEAFYYIPLNYYNYLADKFLNLSLKNMDSFTQELSHLNDVFIFDNIEYFEKKYSINIQSDFITIAKYFNNLTKNEIDNNLSFIQKITKNKSITTKEFMILYFSSNTLSKKKDNFQKRYIDIIKQISHIFTTKFIINNISCITSLTNYDLYFIQISFISLDDKEKLVLNHQYKYFALLKYFILPLTLVLIIYFKRLFIYNLIKNIFYYFIYKPLFLMYFIIKTLLNYLIFKPLYFLYIIIKNFIYYILYKPLYFIYFIITNLLYYLVYKPYTLIFTSKEKE